MARQLRVRDRGGSLMKKDFAVLVLVSLVSSAGCYVHLPEDDLDPAGTEPCWNHTSCKSGCYCSSTGLCKQSNVCSRDRDCAIGFSCDTSRRTCVPRENTPNPTPQPPPAVDAGATPDPVEPPPAPVDAGGKCDSGVATCERRCRFDQECGPQARCNEGACQHQCTSNASCGTGAVCRDGHCQPDDQAGGMCVYASQCSGGSCISGYCHPACQSAANCSNPADACVSGLCRADSRPLDPCTASAQCPGGNACVDGLCRPSCTCDADCAATWWGAGSVCSRGYCASPVELQ
jgi:hypothetical protein